MVAALAPALDRVVCTELPADGADARARAGIGPSALVGAAELAEACARAGLAAEAEPDFGAAVARGRASWPPRPAAILLVTGSHYVLAPARAALAG